MNAVAAIGDNSSRFGMEEKLPPKAERVVNRERAEQALLAARLLSTLFKVPRNRILEKRKGGDEGRALRRPLIAYLRGLGSPVWESAIIFDLDRKQIGQEEASFLEMLADRPGLNRDWDRMVTFFDSAYQIDRARFLQAVMEETDRHNKARKVAKLMAAVFAFLSRPTKAVKRAAPTEVERIHAQVQEKRRANERAQAEKILNRIIEVGAQPNATKEQKKDAERARQAMQELSASKPPRK